MFSFFFKSIKTVGKIKEGEGQKAEGKEHRAKGIGQRAKGKEGCWMLDAGFWLFPNLIILLFKEY